MDFWSELEAVRGRWDVLRHPFYLRWSRGELTRGHLGLYAGQYRHAVAALAEVSDSAASLASDDARRELLEHACEEHDHIAMWDDFSACVGTRPSPVAPETQVCVESWRGRPGATLLECLSILLAIESAQPEIAAVKRRGLADYYGVGAGAPSAYFSVHEHRDLEHARAARRMIDSRFGAPEVDEGAMLRAAESALEGNWTLLDGVQRLCAA